jgi:predicted DsbA family dithiol-disulfide isomerase
MNDALFSIQDEIKSRDVDVELLAVKLGLDRSVFKHCMESDRPVAKIKKDVNAAMNEKLSGTPTFFIGKEKFVGNIPASKLKELLE